MVVCSTIDRFGGVRVNFDRRVIGEGVINSEAVVESFGVSILKPGILVPSSAILFSWLVQGFNIGEEVLFELREDIVVNRSKA